MNEPTFNYRDVRSRGAATDSEKRKKGPQYWQAPVSELVHAPVTAHVSLKECN